MRYFEPMGDAKKEPLKKKKSYTQNP